MCAHGFRACNIDHEHFVELETAIFITTALSIRDLLCILGLWTHDYCTAKVHIPLSTLEVRSLRSRGQRFRHLRAFCTQRVKLARPTFRCCPCSCRVGVAPQPVPSCRPLQRHSSSWTGPNTAPQAGSLQHPISEGSSPQTSRGCSQCSQGFVPRSSPRHATVAACSARQCIFAQVAIRP